MPLNLQEVRHKLNLALSQKPLPREWKDFLEDVETLLADHAWTISKLEKIKRGVELENKNNVWAYQGILTILQQIGNK